MSAVSQRPGSRSADRPAPPALHDDVVTEHAEAPNTLRERAPRTLGLLDQFGFWGNLGVSLFGLTTASTVMYALPDGRPLPFWASVLALVVASALGGAVLGVSLVLGARTGAPAMVLLRGLFGAKASYLPTVLNIVQNLGWGTVEIILIAESLKAVTHDHLPRWLCVLVAGVITTGLTIRPLGAIRVIRKYVTALVVLAIVVLAIGLLRRHIPAVAHSTWGGFWLGVDAVIAVSISWVPLGADYSRHSRTERAAFLGGFVGYGVTQVLCYLVGLIALVELADGADIFSFYLGLPLGTVALAVLVLRETDQSFANTYSTALSIQNLRPTWDRRVLSVGIGALMTLAALKVSLANYYNFLYLIGAVFIPMSGVLIAAWWRGSARGDARRAGSAGGASVWEWDVSEQAPTRPTLLVAWLVGFVTYQVVNPGSLGHWAPFWSRIGRDLHTIGHPWLSASITSFAVALLLALPFAAPAGPRGPVPAATGASADGGTVGGAGG
ncbi:cytosine permease [Jatrophihabitans telluris]|uniref:Cytosine permease n=1 Tax=Jatrophihabitans telluris TaxID=2038343 RepID=A0ABY4QWQ2_9ACTN|nr:cytosine permease [Jatrophihabitans telluris]UQX88083.1 cytosine permease [Jatrophihabitans telluris]